MINQIGGWSKRPVGADYGVVYIIAAISVMVHQALKYLSD
jgi:hypothetical protein